MPLRRSDQREPILGGDVGEEYRSKPAPSRIPRIGSKVAKGSGADKSAASEGNRRGRWRIQPIGY
jgi:hypothetical protein